jgi:succinate dehydrogenase/fumarate reductase flavoprotein subunit
MQYGLDILMGLAEKYNFVTCRDAATMELCNMSVVALEIAKAAMARTESIGAHYIEE